MRLLVAGVLVLGVGLTGCDSGQVTIHGLVISVFQAPGTSSATCRQLGSTATLASRLLSGVSLTFTDQDGTVVGTAIARPARDRCPYDGSVLVGEGQAHAGQKPASQRGG